MEIPHVFHPHVGCNDLVIQEFLSSLGGLVPGFPQLENL